MLPWCLVGDMTNVIKQEDKRGGHTYPPRLLQGFQEVLNDCELYGVELTGCSYTSERGHGTKNWIEIKLDRALVT